MKTTQGKRGKAMKTVKTVTEEREKSGIRKAVMEEAAVPLARLRLDGGVERAVVIVARDERGGYRAALARDWPDGETITWAARWLASESGRRAWARKRLTIAAERA